MEDSAISDIFIRPNNTWFAYVSDMRLSSLTYSLHVYFSSMIAPFDDCPIANEVTVNHEWYIHLPTRTDHKHTTNCEQ